MEEEKIVKKTHSFRESDIQWLRDKARRSGAISMSGVLRQLIEAEIKKEREAGSGPASGG